MKEIIDRLIEEALLRDVKGTILRLDTTTYNNFAKQLEKESGKKISRIGTYRDLSVRIDRESWINKIYIEIL